MNKIEPDRFIIFPTDPAQISAKEKNKLREMLQGVPLADIALDWVLLLKASNIDNLKIDVLRTEKKASRDYPVWP